MLKNIFKNQNILLRNNWLAQSLSGSKTMSDFKQGLIQLPPKKIRFGRIKLLLVVSILVPSLMLFNFPKKFFRWVLVL